MKPRLTQKQKFLSGLIMIHRDKLIKRAGVQTKEERYSGPRLSQYVTGVRIPDYETALHIAEVCGANIDSLPYRRLVL